MKKLHYDLNSKNNGTNKIQTQIYQSANDLLPNFLTGQSLSIDDWQNKSNKYCDFVKVLSGVFRYDSELLIDILEEIKKDDEEYFYQLLLGKCLNLPLLQKKINDLNVSLKKGQKISNLQWRNEVLPMMQNIV